MPSVGYSFAGLYVVLSVRCSRHWATLSSVFMRTTPRFLSAGLMVRVSLACWSLVVCCEGVRWDGSCLHI